MLSLGSFSTASPLNSPSTFRSNFSMLANSSTVAWATDIITSPAPPSLSDNSIILGCGAVALDLLAVVAAYPKPDQKIRSTSFKVQGGGNAGNSLTCAARLGLHPRIIAKVADDLQGNDILEELKSDGVDISFIVVSKGGNSPLTYVIVDKETNTRTCIHTPGNPPMLPEDLSQSALLCALDGVRMVYLDGRLHETALIIAQEARRMNIPILIDAERKRQGMDDLLPLSDYVVCSAGFPQAWTEASSIPSALVSMLVRLPNVKFVIVTLGEDGCIMLERGATYDHSSEETDIDILLEFVKQRKGGSTALPTCLSSEFGKLRAKGIGMVIGRLLVGTAEKIPPSELMDTTGAGDAFIGALLYCICADIPPEKMLSFASHVAAASCRALGARSGLPNLSHPALASFLT